MATTLGAARNIIELGLVHELLKQADQLTGQAIAKAREAVAQAQAIQGAG